jgi:hypothetical protein
MHQAASGPYAAAMLLFHQGWDKTYCLRFVEGEYDEIHFFGDKTFPVSSGTATAVVTVQHLVLLSLSC